MRPAYLCKQLIHYVKVRLKLECHVAIGSVSVQSVRESRDPIQAWSVHVVICLKTETLRVTEISLT